MLERTLDMAVDVCLAVPLPGTESSIHQALSLIALDQLVKVGTWRKAISTHLLQRTSVLCHVKAQDPTAKVK